MSRTRRHVPVAIDSRGRYVYHDAELGWGGTRGQRRAARRAIAAERRADRRRREREALAHERRGDA